MHMLRTCEEVWGEVGIIYFGRKLGWFDRVLELACPTACTYLFKLRPGVLSKTLSHMWGKLNLPMFLFNVGLLTLTLLLNQPNLSPNINNANFPSHLLPGYEHVHRTL